MRNKLANNLPGSGLTLRSTKLNVPILRYQEWLTISYPKKMTGAQLISVLRQSLLLIISSAKQKKLKQLKIGLDPNSSLPVDLGFSKAVLFMKIPTKKLRRLIKPRFVDVAKISTARSIADLARRQFEYHFRHEPEYYTGDFHKKVTDFIKNTQRKLDKEEGFLFLATKNHRPVGFIYSEIDGKEGCIDELFVSESFRGQGIGSALLQKAAERFSQKGFRVLNLFAATKTEAQRIYEHLGFKTTVVYWIFNLK